MPAGTFERNGLGITFLSDWAFLEEVYRVSESHSPLVWPPATSTGKAGKDEDALGSGDTSQEVLVPISLTNKSHTALFPRVNDKTGDFRRSPRMLSNSVSPDEVINRAKVVAVVGASKNPEKEAFSVPLYLMENGFVIIPVNPGADAIHGVKAFPSLGDLPPEVASRVEVVEVFRPSEELGDIARQVVEMKRRTGKTAIFWAQLGLQSVEAERILKANEVPYVMDACMRTQHQDFSLRKVTSTRGINAK